MTTARCGSSMGGPTFRSDVLHCSRRQCATESLEERPKMNKILSAAVTALAVASSGAAYAGSEQEVTGPNRPLYSALETGGNGSEAYPTFGGRRVASQSNVAALTGGSEATQDFAGQAALTGDAGSRFALAAVDDYRFEVVGRPVQNGGIGKMHQVDSESLVIVRLVRKQDSTPVPNAKVTLGRVDMAPDAMGEMAARSYVRPYGAPGEYRVEIHPLMAGKWGVNLAAQVPSDAAPVNQTLTVALAK